MTMADMKTSLILETVRERQRDQWNRLPKASKWAARLYPDLADPDIQAAMKDRGRSGHGLLKETERGFVSKLGGVARRSK
jgi:hypothetical protein